MFPLAALGLGIGAAGDLFKTIFGISQMVKGNKDYRNLIQNVPQYQVDPNILYNQSLAQNIAQQGIPSQARNLYTENVERGLGSTLNAITQGGGGLNMANQVFQSGNDAFRKFLEMDAMQKLQNQETLMNANKDVREENLRAFQQNQMLPFQLKFQRSNQLSNAGTQNLFGGLQDLGKLGMGFGDMLGDILQQKLDNQGGFSTHDILKYAKEQGFDIGRGDFKNYIFNQRMNGNSFDLNNMFNYFQGQNGYFGSAGGGM